MLWLLVIATVLFIIGLNTPIITISQFIFIRNSFSVLSGIFELFNHGQIILFVVVSLFSVVLPILKIWLLFRIVNNRKAHSATIRRYLHLMHDYGRWSMLDVLVVAMLVVMIKIGTIATIQVHFGIFVFGAAVLLIMFLTHRIVTLMTRD
ncbi:MAG: paraquat-inducible protein A [Pseudomonadota bacterium]